MISPEHLIAYLKAEPTISAAVGTASIGGYTGVPVLPELPAAIAAMLPRRAIVVTSSGGPEFLGTTHNLRRGANDVRCYGATVADAWALNEVVYSHLEKIGRISANGKHVVSIRPSGGGIQLREEDGDFPFVFTEYLIVISEV